MVLQEARIFDGNDGLTHDRRDLAQWNFDPILVVQRRQGGAIRGEEHGALGKGRTPVTFALACGIV
jgi:hypothetical protein